MVAGSFSRGRTAKRRAPRSSTSLSDSDDDTLRGGDPDQDVDQNASPNVARARSPSKDGLVPKRPYNKVKRSSTPAFKQRPIHDRKKSKIKRLTEKGAKAAKMEKCCLKKCFQAVEDYDFLLSKRVDVLQMTRAQRKRYVIDLFDDNSGDFLFDGTRVCTRFVMAAFSFSNDTISGVKMTPKARTTAVVEVIPRMSSAPKRELVITFLNQLAEAQGDKMPDKQELIHLTYATPGQVFDVLRSDWTKWCPSENSQILSFSYFLTTWKEECAHIKIRKVHRFALCDTCETLKAAIQKCGTDVIAAKPYRDAREAHNKMVQRERAAYRENQAKASQFPGDYCSIIIDGANQEAFSLPHLPFKIKAESTGYSIKMGLVGLLEHVPGRMRELHLFTMAENLESGANHVIEVLHRWLQKKAAKGKLPGTLLIQLDNCSRENKNKFFMAYIEMMVALGVFEEVRVSFLPKGHTHEDIDQVFSCTARALRPTETITLTDLHKVLRNSYTPRPLVSHLSNMANIRDAMVASKSLLPTGKLAFTQFRYFTFARRAQDGSSRSQTTSEFLTTCSVKGTFADNFVPLRDGTNSSTHTGKGFLCQAPDLDNVPPTCTKALGLEVKDEITKRINALETRINNASKIAELFQLRDDVYTDKPVSLPFAWPADCVERSASAKLKATERDDDDMSISSQEDEEETDIEEGENEYEAGTFVAVRTKKSSDPFWVARIRGIDLEPSGLPQKLDVFWFTPRKENNNFDSSYQACVTKGQQLTGKVPVQSVLVTFDTLNRDGKLPAEVRKNIRSALADVTH